MNYISGCCRRRRIYTDLHIKWGAPAFFDTLSSSSNRCSIWISSFTPSNSMCESTEWNPEKTSSTREHSRTPQEFSPELQHLATHCHSDVASIPSANVHPAIEAEDRANERTCRVREAYQCSPQLRFLLNKPDNMPVDEVCESVAKTQSRLTMPRG